MRLHFVVCTTIMTIKATTGQLLNLPQHIEDDFEGKLITGAVFVDLCAAYDTVNHRTMKVKLQQTLQDSHLVQFIMTMMENRRFFVCLNGQKSLETAKEWSTTGSVLSPTLFNIYTNDQPITPKIRSFLYVC